MKLAWLTLVPVVATAVFALAGVWVTQASEHRRWLRAERLKASVDLLGEAELFRLQEATRSSAAAILDEVQQGSSIVDEAFLTGLENMFRAKARVRIVGPTSLTESAEVLVQAALAVSMADEAQRGAAQAAGRSASEAFAAEAASAVRAT